MTNVLWNRKMERSCAKWSATIAWLGNKPTGNSPNSTVGSACTSTAAEPSMKLLAKQREGKKVRYVYDPAKTPLQRLLLSGALTVEIQQELTEVMQALDPIRLLHQLEQLQQAVFRCASGCSAVIAPLPSVTMRVFSVDDCSVATLPEVRNVGDPTAGLETLYRAQERRKRVLGWRRTHKDPDDGRVGADLFLVGGQS
jgi:hypothetical protein